MIGVAATSLLIECKELRAGESDADDDEATSVCLLMGIGSCSTMFFKLLWQINYQLMIMHPNLSPLSSRRVKILNSFLMMTFSGRIHNIIVAEVA